MATREKAKAERRKQAKKDGPAVAEYKDIRMSSRKARIVADMIRGKPVDEAATILAFQRKYAASTRPSPTPTRRARTSTS